MYICIEGNIGAGKTTIAKVLAKRLKGIYLPENFEENTLLPHFYKNPKKYAFLTEYSFLLERQKQITLHFKLLSKSAITVSDYHFDKCICFANVNLTKNDLFYFKKHASAIRLLIPKPDLIIYINSPINLITQNIKTRSREIESTIKLSYLNKLKKSLDSHYLIKNKTDTKVIHINNYVSNSKSLSLCVNEIELIVKSIKTDL